MTPEFVVQLATFAISGCVGLLAWSLKRNAAEQDKKLDGIADDMRRLSASVGAHGERLAAGDVELRNLGVRLQGLEDRERTRGCFGACRFQGDGG